MNRMESLNLKVVIPSYGQVGTGKDVSLMKQYLNDIIVIAQGIAQQEDDHLKLYRKAMEDPIPLAYQDYWREYNYRYSLSRLDSHYKRQ